MLACMSQEFKFLHQKSHCKVLIGVDYIWHHGYKIEMQGVNRDSINFVKAAKKFWEFW